MKVHHSTQSLFSSPTKSQQNTDSDDSTPFMLPDDSDQQQTQASSVTSSGVPSSISSGFWLSQTGQTAPSTSDVDADQSDGTAPSINGSDSSSNSVSQDIVDEFTKLAHMTPAEKIRAQYLEQHNLMEESFRKLPADQQKAINDEIAKQVKQQLGIDNQADKSDETDSAAAALSIA
ncbi:hypothetical protein [Rhizobium leucaenae]|uniref:Uncharacterized protein n=1 Tax=Rhizobium leucaenae TaxID=29450 RepID=A0A7W6ZTH2_9HYPH|nr:hypothetical protein [Rhizobium leucaenae]MBB4568324.1 hypothetical protein [Rhizobium leucaenae]MBB6300517.1 hypothetical protein [Rhizobium leucaenae]